MGRDAFTAKFRRSKGKINEGLAGQSESIEHVMEENAQHDSYRQADQIAKQSPHFPAEVFGASLIVRIESATICASLRPPAGARCTVSPKSVSSKPRSR